MTFHRTCFCKLADQRKSDVFRARYDNPDVGTMSQNRRRDGLNWGGCDGLDNWQLTKPTDGIIDAMNMLVLRS